MCRTVLSLDLWEKDSYNICSLFINQFMINTLNTCCIKTPAKVSNNNKQGSRLFASYLSIVLVILCVQIPSVEAKETILIESFKSKNDKISMKLLEQTNSFIEYDRYIQSKQFKCKAILKNDLTSNHPENITKIDMELDYGRVLMVNSKEEISGYSADQITQIKRIDKILDLLAGKCLYYQTITFLYQYCHKEHVRQFDTLYTKTYNIKAEFQDISMGTYNPEFYAARRQRKGIKQLTPQEKKVTLPSKSDFSEQHNFFTAQDIDNRLGQMEIEESDDGKLIFTSINLLSSDNYYTDSPLFVEITCESSNNVEIKNYAMAVHPYSLVYTKKAGTCERYIGHKILPDKISYLSDDSHQLIRTYGSYLYGNVQEVCGRNWAWQKHKGNSEYENTFAEGSLLSIELFNQRTQDVQSHYVNIKKVYDSHLIEVQVALGKSFKRLLTSDSYIDSSTIDSKRLVTNITKCQLLFNKKLNLTSKIELNYTGKGLVQLKSQFQIKVGENFGCIFKGAGNKKLKLIDFDITVSNHLWLNYYQAYITTNTFLYQSSLYNSKQYILQQNQDRYCFAFAHQQSEQTVTKTNKFTSIVKLSVNQRSFKFNSSNLHHIFIITIKNNGIVKLITKTTDGKIYTYYISQGQIIKMIEFANGTKEIIKQNKYYQNSTNPTNQIYKNFIYLKISKLPNGTFYGGIWKYRDYVYFPRFTLFGEQLVSLERVNGYAYIRILNIDRMKYSQSLTLVKYIKKLQQHYLMKERLANQQSHLFLDKSYAVGYNYVSGLYCGQPVNKFRKTTVYLTCGKPWFQITKLLQTSPCEYSIRIQTTLLCKQGYKQVVQSDANLLNKGEAVAVVNNGVICHPSKNLYSESSAYLYVKKSIELSLLQ